MRRLLTLLACLYSILIVLAFFDDVVMFCADFALSLVERSDRLEKP